MALNLIIVPNVILAIFSSPTSQFVSSVVLMGTSIKQNPLNVKFVVAGVKHVKWDQILKIYSIIFAPPVYWTLFYMKETVSQDVPVIIMLHLPVMMMVTSAHLAMAVVSLVWQVWILSVAGVTVDLTTLRGGVCPTVLQDTLIMRS